MAETKISKAQAGSGIWTSDSLVAGTNISITQVPQPVIDENTLGVWHFENNLDNAVSGSSYTIATSSQGGLGFNYSDEKKKFGEYSATITGSTTGYYFFPASTPLSSFDNFTIDFWVQTGPSTWGTNYYHRYYIPGTSANQSCVKVEVSSSQIEVLAWTGVSQVIKSCVPSTWVHIAIELYQSKLNVYLNGEKISSSDVGYSPLTFAVNPMGLSLQFDELRLSNVARYQGNNFTPYTVPYSASASPAQYAINNTKSNELPNQTGNSGKYLTTDGTNASWATVAGGLSNTATGSNSLTINGNPSSYIDSTNIGDGSSVGGKNAIAIGNSAATTSATSIAIGRYASSAKCSVAIGGGDDSNSNTRASGQYSVAVGSTTWASSSYCTSVGYGASSRATQNTAVGFAAEAYTGTKATAIGYSAKATAQSAIQLGSGTNSTASTFQVFNTTVVDANGKIPTASLEADLTTKADTDLSNVNNTGTSTGSGWAMPSGTYVDLTLGASGTTYTAPANGYFAFGKKAGSTLQRLALFNFKNSGDTVIGTSIFSSESNNLMAFLPVAKGDSVIAIYTTTGETIFFRFIYAEGSKSEAN